MKNIYHHLRFYAATIIILLVSLYSNSSFAQCNTFHNADSANPILNASPAPQNITNLQFVDIDGDGDKDCYLLTGSSGLVLYRNTGTTSRPQYVLCPNNGFENTTLAYVSNAFAFADMDGDGDLDFIAPDYVPITGNHGGYFSFIQYYENTGTAQNPVFMKSDGGPIKNGSTSPLFGFIDFSFQDIDGDGDLDFYESYRDYPGLLKDIYLNTGTPTAPVYTYYGNLNDFPAYYPYCSFYDFTGDGLPDVVQNDGSSYYFEGNTGTLTAPLFQFPYYHPGPDFGGIIPYTFVDLNGDGAVEEFSLSGHYGTVAPVAVIKQTGQKVGNHTFTRLSASTQSESYKYKWEYNGKIVAGYGKPFIYALKKGEYVLYITDTCGTGVSLPYNTTDNNLTAGNELTADELNAVDAGKENMTAISVKAYPNPFTNELLVQLPLQKSATASTIKITDLGGRLLETQTVSATTLQIGKSLRAGAYLLQVWQKNELVYHTTIMKQ